MAVGKEVGFKYVDNMRMDRAIVLERCVAVPDPDYCVHGKVQCLICQQWCWLGSNSFTMVVSGEAGPVCVDCAKAGDMVRMDRLIGHVDDREHP